jgi:hypothetical protein
MRWSVPISVSVVSVLVLAAGACSSSSSSVNDAGDGSPGADAAAADGSTSGETPRDGASAADGSDGAATSGWPSKDNTGPRTPTTSTQGDVTFSNAGTASNPIVHEKIHYDGVVTLTASASWHVFRDCEIKNTSYWGFRIDGASHIVVEHCDVSGAQTAVSVSGGDDIQVRANNLHDVENGVTTYGTHVSITDNWIHNDGIGMSWGATPHWDGIEVYGGSDVSIVHNELSLDGHDDTSLVNVAPWGMGESVTNVTVMNNRMGGGGYHVTLDSEQPNGPHAVTGIVLSANRHRATGGFGLANIRASVVYTWSDVWDCDGSPAAVGAWPSPCK